MTFQKKPEDLWNWMLSHSSYCWMQCLLTIWYHLPRNRCLWAWELYYEHIGYPLLYPWLWREMDKLGTNFAFDVFGWKGKRKNALL